MMEITKKDFLLNLNEEHDVDEMAYKPKGVQGKRYDPNTGREKPPKMRPYFHEGNDSDIPDGWIKNLNQVPGEDEVLVPLHGAEYDAFIEQNKELLDKLNEIANDKVTLYEGNRLKYAPRNIKVGTKYVPSGEKYSEKEAILRILNPLIKTHLTDIVNPHLIKCGLPPIQTYDNQEFVDKYSEVSNRRIDWESHDYDFYDSVVDFALAAKDLLTKGSTDVKIYRTHMPRQYNPGTNWSPLRKTERMYSNFKRDPLTPVYKLPKRGYEAEDKDVAISTTLHITGGKDNMGQYYSWQVKVNTFMGKKLKEETRVNTGRVQNDNNFLFNTDVHIGDLDGSENILSNDAIRESLIEALSGTAQKILELKPKNELIKRIKVTQTGITKKLDTNEDQLNEFVKDTLKEIID